MHQSPLAQASPQKWIQKEAIFLLFLANTINLFDRQILNSLTALIKTEMNLSDVEIGLVAGTAFGLMYAGLSIPLGRLSDKANRVVLISVAMIIWSASTMLTGWATSFALLFLARLAVGAGQAVFQPAAATLVADLFPANKRASALSLIYLGIPVGSFLALFVGGVVGSAWGWRAVLVMAGIPGLLLATVLFARVRDPRSEARAAIMPNGAVPPIGQDNILTALSTCFRSPGFMLISLTGISFALFLYASGVWLPLFFIRNYGMSVSEIGSLAALSVGVGGTIGSFGTGFLCDLLRPHVQNVEVKAVSMTLLLTVPALLITVFSSDRTVAVAAMFVLNIFAYAYFTPFVILIQSAATPATRALSMAVITAVANILSLAVGLPLIGFMSDYLAPIYGPRAIGYALCFCVATNLLGAFAILRWRRTSKPLGAAV